MSRIRHVINGYGVRLQYLERVVLHGDVVPVVEDDAAVMHRADDIVGELNTCHSDVDASRVDIRDTENEKR